ncbi:hypothetical protein SAMN05443248_3668 [Bradyrhizobium erythrophlei]|uniref:Uncharacterized protein n=1 Tax=Bradyrhizobium erythrophlei TaxID=1437360 RepID=A0A1M5Q763_9BRAD|nr:hypothetical protein SAMN05443248_3668 [Bradyrhizobium erythrophlei]
MWHETDMPATGRCLLWGVRTDMRFRRGHFGFRPGTDLALPWLRYRNQELCTGQSRTHLLVEKELNQQLYAGYGTREDPDFHP